MIVHKTSKFVFVLISGRSGSGKSTLARMLLTMLAGLNGLDSCILSFSSPIKEAARLFFGWNGDKDEKGRALLQKLGDCGREYDADVFAKTLLDRGIDSLSHIIIVDDWRFPNEALYLESRSWVDVIKIRIFRDGVTLMNHRSETSLPDDPNFYQFYVENSGSMMDLRSHAVSIFDYLKNNFILCKEVK